MEYSDFAIEMKKLNLTSQQVHVHACKNVNSVYSHYMYIFHRI